MKINRITSAAAIIFMMVAVVISCKHESLPNNNPPGGGNTGGGNNNTGGTQPCSPDSVYFVSQVLPLLTSNCSMSGCHDATSHQDGVILTNYSSIISTAEVVPGNPLESDLYKVLIETDPDRIMPRPPATPFTQAQKDMIFRWIQQGALNNACNSCDTTIFTFSGAIGPMVDAACKGCHSGASPSGGINLSTYAGVQTIALNGRLYGAISHTPGFVPMPRNANKLSDCQLKQVQKWIAAGALNN